MLVKMLVVAMMVVIFISLTSGLYHLIRDKGNGHRTVKSLTWRIGLSLALFILLLLGFMTGIIQPHSLGA